MKKITPQNLHASLPTLLDRTDFISVFNALLHFLRRGGEKQAAQRFNMLLQALAADKTLCARLGNRLHVWLSKIHIYPALVGLGIFSRSGFAREFGMRVYERFFPSFKNFNNLRDVFLYLFYSQQDTKWLKTIPALPPNGSNSIACCANTPNPTTAKPPIVISHKRVYMP